MRSRTSRPGWVFPTRRFRAFGLPSPRRSRTSSFTAIANNPSLVPWRLKQRFEAPGSTSRFGTAGSASSHGTTVPAPASDCRSSRRSQTGSRSVAANQAVPRSVSTSSCRLFLDSVLIRPRTGGSLALMTEEGRDRRGRDRDKAAAERDLKAAVRDAVADEPSSDAERDARAAARSDREASAADRREGASDRRSAQEARDASRRSGE